MALKFSHPLEGITDVNEDALIEGRCDLRDNKFGGNFYLYSSAGIKRWVEYQLCSAAFIYRGYDVIIRFN